MRLDDVFPKIPKVKRLVVSTPDATEENFDFQIWLRSMQGLANRIEPHLYFVQAHPGTRKGRHTLCEEHWLDYYVQTFDVPVERVDDVDELIQRYKSVVNGYILYDTEEVIQTQNLAITRAGLEGLLPVAPDQEHWMKRHGIPKRDDLRGRFKDDWDAAEWAIDNLWPNCYRRLYANFCIHRTDEANWYPRAHHLEDFIVYHKGMALDLPRSRTHRRSLGLHHKMMDTAQTPGVLMNWHCCWEQEKEYVAEAAKRGFFVLCSIGTPNLTIHGGMGDTEKGYTQPLPKKEECVAEKGKVYVCLYHSDGDATWAMNNLHSYNWLAEQRGMFKFGWGFLPLMVRLMPGMLQYFHETKTDNDCFWGPSSGAAYTYSHLWPKDLVDLYLTESRRLLDQSGQNGCNMVNWNLQDWWREVEDDEAIRREQELLGSGPGLVCGLGGSPYAKSYLDGPVPKLHSVHIANVGRDNIGEIVKFTKECPTRPLFMFLFAQIAVGVWDKIESEMKQYAEHPKIELVSMDEFFVTLQDALKRGLVKDELFETNDELSETWLKSFGRHRLPIAEKLTEELVAIAHAPSAERQRQIADAGWTDLVSIEIENVAADREAFLTRFKGRKILPEEENDAFLYVAFNVAWAVVRAAIQSQGIYANQRTTCLHDFKRTCAEITDMEPFDKLFDAWDSWAEGVPSIEETASWCGDIAVAARQLRDALGPDESEEGFTGWPSRTI